MNACHAHYDTVLAQLVGDMIGNLMVTILSPALGTSKNEPPVHPVAKWAPEKWIQLAS